MTGHKNGNEKSKLEEKMSNELKEKLEYVKKVLSEADTYGHAVTVLS